jgi:hypothetical protein
MSMPKPFVTLASLFLGLATVALPAVALAGPRPELDAAGATMNTPQRYKDDDPQAPRGTPGTRRLTTRAEAAPKSGSTAMAAEKASPAMDLLK